MKKCIYFLALLTFFSSLSAVEAKKVVFDNHSYVCFNDNFYIHDPDCQCEGHWRGHASDINGNYLYSLGLYKYPKHEYQIKK